MTKATDDKMESATPPDGNSETESPDEVMNNNKPAVGACNPDFAIDEYRILQQTIADWGKQIFTIRGWILTIIAGLTVAHLSDKIPPLPFLAVSILATLPLALCELFEGAWQRKAIIRVREVEKSLRGEQPYDGPQINHSLSTSATIGDALKEFPKPLTSAFYLGLFIAVTAISLSSNLSPAEPPETQPETKTSPTLQKPDPAPVKAIPKPTTDTTTNSNVATDTALPTDANEPTSSTTVDSTVVPKSTEK